MSVKNRVDVFFAGGIRAAQKVIHDPDVRAVMKESWSVSWPMAAIMFFTFLMGLADVYVAGRFGKEIQAAYGLAFQIYFLFGIIGTALSVGVVSLVSRLFTSDKNHQVGITVATSLIASAVAGLASGIGAFVFSGIIISFFSVPAGLKDAAAPLCRIYATGIFFNYIFLNINAVLRATGKIRVSLFTMELVCALNVLLNFLFAFLTPMGFRGIAIATVASTIVGCLMNLFSLGRMLGRPWRFSFSVFKQIVSISWPAGMLQVLWQLGAMVLYLVIGALPVAPVETMAAFTNGLKIEAAVFLPAFAFNMANAVVVGNLLGKKERENAFRAGLVTAAAGVAIVSLLSAVVLINARFIASVLSPHPLVVRESITYIFISLLFEPVMAWGVILGGGLNGAGDTKGVMWCVVSSVWLIRLPLSYLCGILWGWGAVSIWWAMNASILFQTVFITRRYYQARWLRPLPELASR